MDGVGFAMCIIEKRGDLPLIKAALAEFAIDAAYLRTIYV
jgi:hypothetical protein